MIDEDIGYMSFDTISGVHVFPGSAETLVRRGGITNHHSIAYSLTYISAKNYQNWLVCVEDIACNISVVFWDTVYMGGGAGEQYSDSCRLVLCLWSLRYNHWHSKSGISNELASRLSLQGVSLQCTLCLMLVLVVVTIMTWDNEKYLMCHKCCHVMNYFIHSICIL